MAGEDLAASNSPEGPGEDESEAVQTRRLIELLEFEIIRIRSEESRPGWSEWALLGAVATVAWLLTLQIEAHEIDALNTLVLVLAFSLACDSLGRLFPVAMRSTPSRASARFTFTHTLFSSSRTVAAVEAARCIALIGIAAYVRPVAGALVAAAAGGFYGVFLLLWLSTVVFSFLRWPVPVKASGGRWSSVALGVLIGLAMAGFLGLMGIIWRQDISPTVYDARVGGLLAGVGLMVGMLAGVRPHSPLVDSLVYIRQSLGLGHMDVESARRQTEIALAGLTAGEVLQDELSRLLSLLAKAAVQMEALAAEVDAARSVMPDDLAFSESDLALLSAAMRSARGHAEDARAATDECRQRFEALKRRVVVFGRLEPGSRPELEGLLDKLDAGLEQVLAKTALAEEALANVGRILGLANEEGEGA